MKIHYQCSNCGKRFQTSAMVGIPNGMYYSGCRVVGDAFYCEECVKSWKDRNKEEFDKQYKNSMKMFNKWWNKRVNEQAKIECKEVKSYKVISNVDYVESEVEE